MRQRLNSFVDFDLSLDFVNQTHLVFVENAVRVRYVVILSFLWIVLNVDWVVVRMEPGLLIAPRRTCKLWFFHHKRSTNNNLKHVERDGVIKFYFSRVLDDAPSSHVLKLPRTTKGQVKLIDNFFSFIYGFLFVPALNRCLVRLIVNGAARVAVLVDYKLVERAIDHSQSHLKRVLDPMVFLVFFTKGKRLAILFFLLQHHH